MSHFWSRLNPLSCTGFALDHPTNICLRYTSVPLAQISTTIFDQCYLTLEKSKSNIFFLAVCSLCVNLGLQSTGQHYWFSVLLFHQTSKLFSAVGQTLCFGGYTIANMKSNHRKLAK